MKKFTLFGWTWRFLALLILFCICYIGGAQTINGKLPDIKPEPGLVPVGIGLLLVGISNTILVMALVLSSRWSGLYLASLLSLAYFGAVTFVMQIETWYFLSNITVNAELMPYLFIMGLPVAFLFVPLSVWILGKGRKQNSTISVNTFAIPFGQWIWKLSLIAVCIRNLILVGRIFYCLAKSRIPCFLWQSRNNYTILGTYRKYVQNRSGIVPFPGITCYDLDSLCAPNNFRFKA